MIYPKGLSKNSSCMTEFYHQQSPVFYKLPLRSCNTMSTQLVSHFFYLLGSRLQFIISALFKMPSQQSNGARNWRILSHLNLLVTSLFTNQASETGQCSKEIGFDPSAFSANPASVRRPKLGMRSHAPSLFLHIQLLP